MNLLLSSYQTLIDALRRTIALAKASTPINKRSHSTAAPDAVFSTWPPSNAEAPFPDVASREEEPKKKAGDQPSRHD